MDIKNKSQFIEYFSKGIKNQNNLKIGVEHERFLFEGENKKRISYETLKKLFENLKVNGWEPLYEKENIIGMQRDDQQITTEPGLQCELSGAPLENIHKVCSESSKFLKEIEAASKGLNINRATIMQIHKITRLKRCRQKITIFPTSAPSFKILVLRRMLSLILIN